MMSEEIKPRMRGARSLGESRGQIIRYISVLEMRVDKRIKYSVPLILRLPSSHCRALS